MIPGRVVEIAEDGRHLAMRRGFMVVEAGREEIGRVALDDIGAVIANAHGVTYSNNLLMALAERNAPVVFCAANHSPAALLWPVAGHYRQTARMRAQIDARQPLRKRLWQTLVQAKLRMQASAVDQGGGNGNPLRDMARRVRSGDPENLEAQGARRYWPLMFGPAFRRDPAGAPPNDLLNYGYAVLRAATARAVMASGLHPTLGVHHHNQGNPMCLVDDLMEPFRPMVDCAARELALAGVETPTPEAKRGLVGVMLRDMATEIGTTPLATCLLRLAGSLATSYEAGRVDLVLPRPPPRGSAAVFADDGDGGQAGGADGSPISWAREC